jgi:hypothetical protein
MSVKAFDNLFTLRTYTKELYKIDKAVITDASGLALSPAPFTALTLSSPVSPIFTGVATIYTIKVTSENGVAPANQGTLIITLPSDIAFIKNSPTC